MQGRLADILLPHSRAAQPCFFVRERERPCFLPTYAGSDALASHVVDVPREGRQGRIQLQLEELREAKRHPVIAWDKQRPGLGMLAIGKRRAQRTHSAARPVAGFEYDDLPAALAEF